jgi:hypothetical protein
LVLDIEVLEGVCRAAQAARESEALWVVPRSTADIEDEVVATISSSLLSDRGIDTKTDMQARTTITQFAAFLSGAVPAAVCHISQALPILQPPWIYYKPHWSSFML